IMGIACDLKAWVQRRHPLQRCWVLVTYSGDFAVGEPMKVPHHIGPPITIANDAHSEHVVHFLSLVGMQAQGSPVRVHDERVWAKAPHPVINPSPRGRGDRTARHQRAPSHLMTAQGVWSNSLRSVQRDRWAMYCKSRRTMSSKVVRLRPCTCQRPVRPGFTSSTRRRCQMS